MDFSVAPPTTVPAQQAQSAAQPAQNGADGPTVQKNPAQVVTVAGAVDNSRNEESVRNSERQEDRRSDSQKQDGGGVSEQVSIDSAIKGRRTEYSFNFELNQVFLEIINTRTEKVIEQIPPEGQVRRLQENQDRTTTPSAGKVDETA